MNTIGDPKLKMDRKEIRMRCVYSNGAGLIPSMRLVRGWTSTSHHSKLRTYVSTKEEQKNERMIRGSWTIHPTSQHDTGHPRKTSSPKIRSLSLSPKSVPMKLVRTFQTTELSKKYATFRLFLINTRQPIFVLYYDWICT